MQDFTIYAIDVLVLESLDRIPAAGPGIRVVPAGFERYAIAAGRGSRNAHAQPMGLKSLEYPVLRELTILLTALDVRRAIPELLFNPRAPQVQGLADVRISGKQLVVGHGPSFLP
jgi:hypothetical protein